jgi:hypothetical protein
MVWELSSRRATDGSFQIEVAIHIRLNAKANAAKGKFQGHMEEVDTGRDVRFISLEELLASMRDYIVIDTHSASFDRVMDLFAVPAGNASSGWRVHPVPRSAPDQGGDESTVSSRIVAGDGASRSRNHQEDGTRILFEGRVRSSMGGSANHPHTTTVPDHAAVRGS